mmetsp:Transcript_5564/g.13068  ORF Transcript_5564/g.13068 Transcript_5564/m.13068 type:complete len:353 (+) Transcript_5564:99-1157(+)
MTEAVVTVPRHLLQEVLADGCCPLHLRLQLARALDEIPSGGDGDGGGGASSSSTAPPPLPLPLPPGCSAEDADNGGAEVEDGEAAAALASASSRPAPVCPFSLVDHHYLASVAAFMGYPDFLSLRATSREQLQWAMQRGTASDGPRHWVHDRIRARLWMRRITDLTTGTKDESIFETGLRSLADGALRTRMETEMQEALTQMEEQIREFQAEVDRRLEEQESHVRHLVDERVQQELDQILAAEVVKVQAMVEQRVRERVSALFQREVRDTVRDLQNRLDMLLQESEVLRDAFAEANYRAKCLFWAMVWPPALTRFSLVASHLGGAPNLQRRLQMVCSWLEVDFRVKNQNSRP